MTTESVVVYNNLLSTWRSAEHNAFSPEIQSLMVHQAWDYLQEVLYLSSTFRHLRDNAS